MNVTDDVVKDLLAIYLAGEAHPDTRVLVEEWLRTHPEVARQVEQARGADLPAVACAIHRTRRGDLLLDAAAHCDVQQFGVPRTVDRQLAPAHRAARHRRGAVGAVCRDAAPLAHGLLTGAWSRCGGVRLDHRFLQIESDPRHLFPVRVEDADDAIDAATAAYFFGGGLPPGMMIVGGGSTWRSGSAVLFPSMYTSKDIPMK